MGRAIGACHRGAARAACLADLTRAVRNILGSIGGVLRWRMSRLSWIGLMLGPSLALSFEVRLGKRKRHWEREQPTSATALTMEETHNTVKRF